MLDYLIVVAGLSLFVLCAYVVMLIGECILHKTKSALLFLLWFVVVISIPISIWGR